MAHKKTHTNPVPPANRAQGIPGQPEADEAQQPEQPTSGAPFQEQDAKRRLGNYESAGEHAFVQPGGKNDANR